MRRFPNPIDALAALNGYLFAWVPVCLAGGIGGYFSLMAEPQPLAYLVGGFLALGSGLLWLRGPLDYRPVAAMLCLLVLGALVAGARSNLVAAPVLGFRYYGPVEGRVLLIDRSSSDQIRLTLDRVVLERLPPDRTPTRVRITIGAEPPPITLEPGQTVILTGFLSPPEGPVEPGGFDFQRMAWFLRLGAVGFSRSPVLALAPPERSDASLFFARLRQSISDGVRASFPTDAGGFVTAVLTNDISGISKERLASLRASNLAHILSISGLHMALLTGFVFTTLRSAIALVPPLALRVSSKKLAAVVGLAAAAFYLGLSGGGVATQRSFVMVAVMLFAILVDRRAISLRSIAIAAIIVLLLEPESLTEPGFQMSFAATVALVSAFEALRNLPSDRWHPPRWLVPVLTLLISSAVAGAATAPFGAAAFNKLSGYGLLANMLAVPLMGLVLMPAAVVAAVLAPFGLAYPALWVMEYGARWILWISDAVAGLGGAVVPVVSPPALTLPLLSLGALWVILLPGKIRWVGVAPIAAAFLFWGMADRPALLITEDAKLIGLLTEEGRVLSKGRGSGFAAKSWLEDDGDAVSQSEAHARAGFTGNNGRLEFRLGAQRVVHLAGAAAIARAADDCDPGTILIVAGVLPSGSVSAETLAQGPVTGSQFQPQQDLEALTTEAHARVLVANAPTTDAPGPQPDQDPSFGQCLLIDQKSLDTTGSVALWLRNDGQIELRGARTSAGQRVWNAKVPSRAGPARQAGADEDAAPD